MLTTRVEGIQITERETSPIREKGVNVICLSCVVVLVVINTLHFIYYISKYIHQ